MGEECCDPQDCEGRQLVVLSGSVDWLSFACCFPSSPVLCTSHSQPDAFSPSGSGFPATGSNPQVSVNRRFACASAAHSLRYSAGAFLGSTGCSFTDVLTHLVRVVVEILLYLLPCWWRPPELAGGFLPRLRLRGIRDRCTSCARNRRQSRFRASVPVIKLQIDG